jgi:hypothetical protein
MPETLDYATAALARPRLNLLRLCRFSALVPMSAGILCVVLFAATGSSILTVAGLLLLPFGLICVLAGLILLNRYAAHAKHHQTVPKNTLARQRLTWILLLLANFPVAFVCAVVGIFLATGVVVPVVVHNAGLKPVTAIHIQAPGQEMTFQNLMPGQSVSTNVTVSSPGRLTLTFNQDGRDTATELRNWFDSDEVASSAHTKIAITIRDGVASVR